MSPGGALGCQCLLLTEFSLVGAGAALGEPLSETSNGEHISGLCGRAVEFRSPEILLPLAAEAAGHPLILVLDDVQYIDSAGMAAIDTLRSSSALCIVVPRHSIVRRALEIVGFDQLTPNLRPP